IQQSSDATYRVYDWDRKDDQGNPRQLHIQEAIEALDFKSVGQNAKSAYDYVLNKTSELVTTPYFTTNVLHLTETIEKDYSALDSFVVYLCVEGGGIIHTLGHQIPIIMGEVVLIPAIAENTIIEPIGLVSILETYIL
ncbi:MAG: mannose-6-phosphate isomerase, partial [Bacteroidales bacterium]|nr:mannose-6-phosphate isomerase [Bacteroidales bacterium]